MSRVVVLDDDDDRQYYACAHRMHVGKWKVVFVSSPKKMFARFLLPKPNATERNRRKNDLAKQKPHTNAPLGRYNSLPNAAKNEIDQIRMKKLEKIGRHDGQVTISCLCFRENARLQSMHAR